MTRIVAGSAKGRTIQVPKSGTRPTSERVREALFSRLEHFGYIQGCVVLDLYAGSGALALEALSRGATAAVAVEAHGGAVKIISANASALELPLQVVNAKVDTYLTGLNAQQFDLVFLDPPYDLSEESLAKTLELLVAHLKDDAMVVVERAVRSAQPLWPAGLELDDERKWGDTRVWTAIMQKNNIN